MKNNQFIHSNIKAIRWEFVLALILNLVLLGVLAVLKCTPSHVPVPVEISVDITDFTPPAVKEMEIPVEIASGTAGALPAADPEALAASAMQDFTPQPEGGLTGAGQTATERLAELDRIEKGIRTFEGINQVKTGLRSGAMPAGLEVGASFKGRGDGKVREQRLRRHGGGEATESAVEKALRFLGSAQNKNGSWGSEESFRTGDFAALSSLALLAFFSHGENFQSEKYGDTIRRGCDFLVESANLPDIEYAGGGFGHAILTYALAEGYAVSGSMSLRNALEQRLKFIVSRQNGFGSFALNYDNTPMTPPTREQQEDPLFREIVPGEPACDLSLLGWHIQALTAARNAGVTVEGMDKALTLAAEALVKIHQAEKGGFSQGINLKRFGANDNLNPVGLLGLQLLNSGNSSPARRAEKILHEVPPPKWKQGGQFPLYRWYYQTQALFQAEKGRGDRWEKWNENLKKELFAAQNREGGWSPPGGDPGFRVKNASDLAIYSSSLCALMLQVYYRYLPGYSIAESAAFASRADDFDIGGAGLITRLPGGADPLAGVILGIGENDMEPVRFGKFDGIPADSRAPHATEEFRIHASMRSTVPIRSPEDWPQLLQPNQRFALFFDDLIPRNFKGHLKITLGLAGHKDDAFENRQSLEAIINGKRLFNSCLLTDRQLIELIVPADILQPFGNILQIRNNGGAALAFDAAMIGAIGKVGPPLTLSADKPEELPPSLRAVLRFPVPEKAILCRLPGFSENRQLLSAVKEYAPENSYVAEYAAAGSEHMGNEFQLHYLRQAAREIVDWIAGGGTGIKLTHIMEGGKFYDSLFGTPYAALSALRQAAKLFDGSPHKLAAQYYPKYGDKPQIFGNAAASYNAPGVATIVVTKRFPIPEEAEVIAIVPWSGATDVTIEQGFLPDGSPFAGFAQKIQTETKTAGIENNVFRYSGVFPELTVIRLVRKEAKAPPRIVVTARDIPKTVKYDFTTVKNVLPPEAKTMKKHAVFSGGFAAVYGQNFSFSRIPATEVKEGPFQFVPADKNSIAVGCRLDDSPAGRADSAYLSLQGASGEAQYLTFNVYTRTSSTVKRSNLHRVRMRFELNGRCYALNLPVERWHSVVLPLDGVNPGWRHLRILEPGDIPEKGLQAITYEINDISIWSLP